MANSLKKLLGLAALTAVGGGIAYLKRRQLIAQLLKLPPPVNEVAREPGVAITMPDGVTLKADVYHPLGLATAPTILTRTPYNRKSINQFFATLFAERGFNVVSQDVRGRFGSDGRFEPYVHEAADGEATLAWIAEQPWSNGRIGMWGQSYVGFVQWAAASTGTPHLHAMLPAITQSNLGGPNDHGFMWLDRTLRWILLLDAMMDRSLSAWEKMGLSYYAPEQNKRVSAGWNHLPLATADAAVLGHSQDFYQIWAQHYAPDDPYWQAVDLRRKVPQIGVPMHLVAGWYDIFLRGQLADYAALRQAGHEPYLTIGPWTHMAFPGMLAAVREGLAWFSAKLKGDAGAIRPYPVQIYLQGANKWLGYESWPPPAEQEAAFYLQPLGELSTDEPPTDAPPDQYRYDPADPTPNLGGALLSTEAGPVDNRPLEARPDVLTYTTEPLTAPLTVIGHVRLRLFVRSSLEFTDFYGRLCDVWEDGRSLNVCDGLFRIQPGRGEPQPDGSLLIEVDMTATAYQFQPGHRLRLQVSSGAHPRISRNLGTGDPVMHGTAMHAANQTIYHDSDHPSALILPLT
ncbi:MAG: CocE/NonD family hydrolase [Ardenticatenaceae bacterium]|nr:CocE/NonD family hydrolase [Anaerolineales bacterium]MCB8941842.1 CocE/NonD family hydrolase [Ardenticatenaceae bacterium]MCB8972956.1 CocE/NonD family hydrolase [Ardenticatenaceae bacterium]